MVFAYELMPLNYNILERKYPRSGEGAVSLMGFDFLESKTNLRYSGIDTVPYIIANPPFAKNQDIDHIRHMYRHLAPGGRLVTLSSRHWEFSDNRKEREFREFLADKGASIETIDAGEFKSSGTMVATNMITLDKARS